MKEMVAEAEATKKKFAELNAKIQKVNAQVEESCRTARERDHKIETLESALKERDKRLKKAEVDVADKEHHIARDEHEREASRRFDAYAHHRDQNTTFSLAYLGDNAATVEINFVKGYEERENEKDIEIMVMDEAETLVDEEEEAASSDKEVREDHSDDTLNEENIS